MKLQTHIPLTPSPTPIGYDSRILLLGSCFVINMGRKLEYYKFRMLQNPFGILYHPPAIEKLLSRALLEDVYTEEELFSFREGWHCFDVHSEMSRGSAGELLGELNSGLKITAEAVRDSTHIILTLGTAWVYRLVSTAALVANCHKLPQREFRKELLSTEEIVSSLRKMIADIRAVNKEAQFIFTISPVRHLKDGFTGNQRSKARLISAVHDFIEGLADDPGLVYFPAYEILMDELRDYRFYEADLLHPNLLAIDYVWEKFMQACISPETYPVMEEVGDIQKRLQHKPFRPDSAAYREFRRVLQEKIAYLKKDYPHIDFER